MSNASFVALVGVFTWFACSTNDAEQRRGAAGTSKALTPKEAARVLPTLEGARELLAPRMIPQGRFLAQYCVIGAVSSRATSLVVALQANWTDVSVRSPSAERRLVSATRGQYTLHVSLSPGKGKCDDSDVLLSMTVLKPLAATPRGPQAGSTPHG